MGECYCSECNTADDYDPVEDLLTKNKLQAERIEADAQSIADLRGVSEGQSKQLRNQHSTIAQMKQENATLRATAELVEKQKDGAYSERDKLVCALSKLLPSWLERHPDEDTEWEDDWRWIVFVDGSGGHFKSRYMSWHIHESELEWFDHLRRCLGNSWDGHTTEEKYERLSSLEALGETK